MTRASNVVIGMAILPIYLLSFGCSRHDPGSDRCLAYFDRAPPDEQNEVKRLSKAISCPGAKWAAKCVNGSLSFEDTPNRVCKSGGGVKYWISPADG